MNIIKRVKEWLCGSDTTTTTQQPEATSFDILLEELFVKHPMFVVDKENGTISTTEDWEIVGLTGESNGGVGSGSIKYNITLKHRKIGLEISFRKIGKVEMPHNLKMFFRKYGVSVKSESGVVKEVVSAVNIPQEFYWHAFLTLSGKTVAPTTIAYPDYYTTLNISPNIIEHYEEEEKLRQVLSDRLGEAAALSLSITQALKEKEQEEVNKRREEESIKRQLAHKQSVCENVRELLEKLNKEEE